MKSILFLSLLLLTTCNRLKFTEENKPVGQYLQELGEKFSMNIFERAGYTKEMLNVGGFGGFLNKANMILDMVGSVIDAVRTSVSNNVKEFKEGKGFDYLKIKTEMDSNFGFREKGYDVFVEETIKDLKIPEKFQERFKAVLEEGGYTEKNTWGDFNIIFDKDNGKDKNELNFVNVMMYHYRQGEKDKFDSIISHGIANFHLVSNEYIWTKSKFIAGGIEQCQKDYIQSESRDLKYQDIQAIMYYFTACSLVDLYKVFGVDLTPAIIKK